MAQQFTSIKFSTAKWELAETDFSVLLDLNSNEAKK